MSRQSRSPFTASATMRLVAAHNAPNFHPPTLRHEKLGSVSYTHTPAARVLPSSPIGSSTSPIRNVSFVGRAVRLGLTSRPPRGHWFSMAILFNFASHMSICCTLDSHSKLDCSINRTKIIYSPGFETRQSTRTATPQRSRHC